MLRDRLERDLERARARTHALTGIDDSELTQQHSPLMSPLVWDLAHIANQEERWLLREVAGRGSVHEGIDELYDAFLHPRASRTALPLLGPDDARRYAERVRELSQKVLQSNNFDDELTRDGFVFSMIAQHEQQHDETMLATHQLRAGPPVLDAPEAPREATPPEYERVSIPAGEFEMGTSDDPWALDNEKPAHRVYLPAFALDTLPVTNRHFAYSSRTADTGAASCGATRGGRTAATWVSRRLSSGTAMSTDVGGDGVSDGSCLCIRTNPSCTCVSTRPMPSHAGRARVCPPRRNGRRPRGGIRRRDAVDGTRGETTTPARSTPISASDTWVPQWWVPTRKGRLRSAYIS